MTANVDPKTGYFIGLLGTGLGEAILIDGSPVQSLPLAAWHVVVRNAAGRVIARSG